MNHLPISGNSLVGERDDDNSLHLPKGWCVCARCEEVAIDATNDGIELCAPCLQIIAEQQQEALELSQQIQFEKIWKQVTNVLYNH